MTMTRKHIKLTCQHGSFGMREPAFEDLGDGSWGVQAPCELGEHWLTPDPEHPGLFIFRATPYPFASEEDAHRAAERHAAELHR